LNIIVYFDVVSELEISFILSGTVYTVYQLIQFWNRDNDKYKQRKI